MDAIPRTPMISTSYNHQINSTIKPQNNLNTSYFYNERDENTEKKLKNLQLECQRLTEVVSYVNNGIQIEELLKTINSLKEENSRLEKKAAYIYLHYNNLKVEKQKNLSYNEKEMMNLRNDKMHLELEVNELKSSLSEALEQLATEKSNTEYLKNQINLLETNHNSKLIEYERKMEEMFIERVNNDELNEKIQQLQQKIIRYEDDEVENRILIEQLQKKCVEFLKEREQMTTKLNQERATMLSDVQQFKNRLEHDLNIRNEKITQKNNDILNLKKEIHRLKSQLNEANSTLKLNPPSASTILPPPVTMSNLTQNFNALKENMNNILLNNQPLSNNYLKSNRYDNLKEKENHSNSNYNSMTNNFNNNNSNNNNNMLNNNNPFYLNK